MSVEQVIDRLRGVEQRLPEGDGVRWFNELYLRVTERVRDQLHTGGFEDANFMEHLDRVFTDLYFEALGDQPSPAWQPLLDARSDSTILPGRFMLAGVNAHVNYDLPIALVQTCRWRGVELAENTPCHRDFERIDDILTEVEDAMHRRLHTSQLKAVIALWGVIRARGRAWNTALRLAALPPGSGETSELLQQLAGTVAEWSELLLRLPG